MAASIFITIAFFYWETLLPAEMAAMFVHLPSTLFGVTDVYAHRPPRTWFYPNLSALFGLALLPFFWWTTIYTIFMNLWQDVFHWSVISAAVHMYVQWHFTICSSSGSRVPVGAIAFVMSFGGGILSRVINPKWIILLGLSLMCVSTAGFALAGGNSDRYWTFILPVLLVGSTGTMLTFTHAK